MAKMIQIRHVENEIHAKLKRRALVEGMSLSDFLKREIERIASQPSLKELTKKILSRTTINSSSSSAQLVRRERNAR